MRTFPDEQDAQRYRWLREQFWQTSDIVVISGGRSHVPLGTLCPRTDVLDEIIDKALGVSKATK